MFLAPPPALTMLDPILDSICYYRAHTKYDAKVMFSPFLSFCSQEGGLKNTQNFMESPKRELKLFHTIILLTRCGGGGILSSNFVHYLFHHGGGERGGGKGWGSLVPTVSTSCATRGGGETGGGWGHLMAHLVDTVGTKDPTLPPYLFPPPPHGGTSA